MRIAVGLITHQSSPYRDTETFRDLVDALEQLSGKNGIHIEDRNQCSAADLPPLARLLRPIIHGSVVWKVARFRGLGVLESMGRTFRLMKMHIGHGFGERAIREIVRNLNITAAHLAVWDWGIGKDSDWVGAFEDDLAVAKNFSVGDIQDVAESVNARIPGGVGVIIFLSRSFAIGEHGAQAIVDSQHLTKQGVSVSLSRRGFSDTVAATLYSKDALQRLLSIVASFSPLVRAVVPIDWLLDLAFIRLADDAVETQFPLVTAHLDHGLFRQQSL